VAADLQNEFDGSSEMMPKATAPEDVSTPSRLNTPDHTTAKFAGSERV
jgi:hypothetical protein